MRNDYNVQLENIESNFNRERTQILERNKKEIDMLFEEQKSIEQNAMQERINQENEYTEDLEKLRTQDANDQAEQKIKLEKEMQTLQKCMEDKKAVYRLNEEKLEFNH